MQITRTKLFIAWRTCCFVLPKYRLSFKGYREYIGSEEVEGYFLSVIKLLSIFRDPMLKDSYKNLRDTKNTCHDMQNEFIQLILEQVKKN